MDFDSLRSTLFRWLPIFLLMLVVLGLTIYAARTVLPSWQTYSTLAAGIGTQQVLVGTQLAAQDGGDNLIILQSQIDRINEALNAAGEQFLTNGEADEVLNRLYRYAYARGVRVVNLQAQQPASATSTAPTRPYEIRQYQLQVGGGVANLIDFLAYFQDASLPSVNIVNMDVTQNADQALLTMNLVMYTSPYASGHALDPMPTPLPPTPTDPPTATPLPTLPPTETPVEVAVVDTPVPPTETPPPSATMTASVTPSPTLPPSATLQPTPTRPPSATPVATVIPCEGAQPTLFQPGDVAIVDFNGLGALRVLADPNGSIVSTRTQAYDNQSLEIIAGPVCANHMYYWYIRNLSQNNALGWVAEGQGDQRFLCPEDDPECVP